MQIGSISNTAPAAARVADQPPAQPAAPAPAVQAAAAVQTEAAVTQVAAVPSAEQLQEAIKSINKTLKGVNQDLEFSIDADTRRTILKVVDQQTGEVIRQLPSEEALEIAKALDRLQGLLLSDKA
ncbi:MAG: flagellar protein FlaG [Burkholderiaceae bacterium]